VAVVTAEGTPGSSSHEIPLDDPLGVASPLDAGEEDPDAAAVAELPGHGVDEVVDEAPGGTAQEPAIGSPAQDH
jgi:hypothetical protein